MLVIAHYNTYHARREQTRKTVRATQIIQSFPYSENGGKVMGIYEVLLDPPAFAAVFAPV